MEYFDFEGASSAHESNHQSDDVASVELEFDEPEEQTDRFNSLLHDQEDLPLEFPIDPPVPESAEQNAEVPVGPDQDTGVYPMFRAQEPCDFCRRMGLDCFIAKRGVMQEKGCTCCISLWRECSFKHARVPGRFLQTLQPVTENAYIPEGSLTGLKALKSVSYNTFGDDPDGRSRKSSARFSRKAVNILKSWLREHNENPYPTEPEKDQLKESTGLTRTQISNWLANARRRGKVPPAGTESPGSGAVNIPGQQHPRDVSLMTPLERWKYSPPENEPATISDINRALANPPFDPARQRQKSSHVRRRPGSSTNDSSHASSEHKRYTASGSSLDTSRSSLSDLSFASAFSHRSSLGSFGSMDRKERRRRRKTSTPINTFNQQKARASRPFQCTFCTDSFAAKYDWQRHEKSMHLILDQWTCSPHGGVTEENNILRCVFCSIANPDKEHMETHNYISCQEKSLQERTFFRKDHLNQHLRLMHNAKFQRCMDRWQSSITEVKSRCGFCGTTLLTWKDRVDHLAGHFKNGANMAQWQGDWGFEPWIQERVENAIPPFMIGFEWRSPNPWTTDGNPPALPVPMDANCYHRLSRELTTYIHNQTAQGIVPTDEMLQSEARRVIYCTDDPWNQTCADNPIWLGILKRETGLEAPAHDENIQFSDLGLQPPYAAVKSGPRGPAQEAKPLATTNFPGALPSPAVSSPGIRSPAYPGTGFSSAAASRPGSLSGSYAGSSGMISAGIPAFASDWGSSMTGGQASSSSAPADGGAHDPLVQMGFDPAFLQRLSDNYSELTPPDIDGMDLGEPGDYSDKGKQPWVDPTSPAQPGMVPASDPIVMDHLSQKGGAPASNAAQPGMPAFQDNIGNF
jgi:hypothetical protein